MIYLKAEEKTMHTDNNPDLNSPVGTDTELKSWLVNYVGNKLHPEEEDVTVENVVEVVADEFPEFLLVVAEENWMRGYQQALNDVDEGEKILRERENDNPEGIHNQECDTSAESTD